MSIYSLFKKGNQISVKDFGAVGDGVTDDTAAIQAAIDHAATIVGNTYAATSGMQVFFPNGTYLISSTLIIEDTEDGIGLVGESGKGSKILTNSDITVLQIGLTTTDKGLYDAATNTPDLDVSPSGVNLGDSYKVSAAGNFFTTPVSVNDILIANTANANQESEWDINRVISCYNTELKNLFFVASSTSNTSTAIKIRDGGHIRITDCEFVQFYISIHCARIFSSFITRCQIKNEGRTTQAEAGIKLEGSRQGTGGGLHITDCELSVGAQGVTSSYSESAIAVYSVDGLYINNCHLIGYDRGLNVIPSGDLINNSHRITDIMVSNCYFDTGRFNAVKIGGTSPNDTGGFYQNIKFNNCYFRDITGSNAELLLVDVAEGTQNEIPNELKILGCTFNSSSGRAISIKGADSAAEEWEGIVIDGCSFENNNADSVSEEIFAEATSAVISNNIFLAPKNSYTYPVFVNNSNPTRGNFVVTGNNFASSDYTNDTPVRVIPLNEGNICVSNNLHKGSGTQIDECYKLTTTDATQTDVFSQTIAEGTSGFIRATVTGHTTGADVNRVMYVIEATFYRNVSNSLVFSTSPVNVYADKSASPAAPTVEISGTTVLKATVTGVASTTMEWNVRIELTTSR